MDIKGGLTGGYGHKSWNFVFQLVIQLLIRNCIVQLDMVYTQVDYIYVCGIWCGWPIIKPTVNAGENNDLFYLEMDNKLSGFYIIFNVFVVVYNIITYNQVCNGMATKIPIPPHPLTSTRTHTKTPTYTQAHTLHTIYINIK